MNTQIERIKDYVLIENVLDRYGIRHSHGRCCCPIHDGDNATSFSFNDQVFHCHSCGASGDVFQLIQHLERVEFKESLKLAAAMAGITVEDCFHGRKKSNPPKPTPTCDPEPVGLILARAGLNFELKRLERATRKLRELPSRLESSEIGLGKYYLEEQILDNYKLPMIDTAVIALTHRVHALEKEWRAQKREQRQK